MSDKQDAIYVDDLYDENVALRAENERLRAWAEQESAHWHGRNADRYWQMQRVLHELGRPKDG